LHAAVVEIIAKEDSHVRYTTIQNWSSNVYNLVTKRAVAQANATVEWVDGNIGSRATMKYPCVILSGPKARANILSLALAGRGQHQDTGAKIIHSASDTSSTIVNKSISKDGGHTTYRGLVKVTSGVKNIKASVNCDALILDSQSTSDTIPDMQIMSDKVSIVHEASVGKINPDQLFYLQSRGISKNDALNLIVNGFIEPFVRELPMEYAFELNRLIEIEMEESVG
jgi:Fe-S cluster assembly protein SufB